MTDGSRSWRVAIVALGDAIIINLSFIAAFWLRFGGLPEENFVGYRRAYLFFTVSVLVLYAMYDLYSSSSSWAERFYSLFAANVVLIILSLALSFMVRGFSLPRTVFAIAFVLQVVESAAWRRLAWQRIIRPVPPGRVLVVASEGEGQRYLEKLRLELRGTPVVMAPGTEDLSAATRDPEHESNREALVRTLEALNPDRMLIGASINGPLRRDLLLAAADLNIAVWLAPDIYDLLILGAKTSFVGDGLFLDVPAFESESPGVFKRSVDLMVAALGLLIASPVMLLIAAAVRIDSPGPVIYSQTRTGRGGREFKLYKFRSMVRDAEETTGPVLSGRDDPRLTRVGRFIRRTRLDELPQLVNIIQGNMSIVGPRPERPYFVSEFEDRIPGYHYRHSVTPGLTGLAQVRGRYSTDAEDKLRLDLLYARTNSGVQDLKIMLLTVKTIMMKEKAE